MTAVRIALGVIAGYAVMFAIVFVGIAVAWAVLGAANAFQEGRTEASTLWSVMNCVFGLLASAAGGLVAAAVGKQKAHVPVMLLAGLVLALGLAMAVQQLGSPAQPLPEGKAVADLAFFEAGEIATSPDWYNFAIPWIGALGVLLGGNFARLAKR